MTIETKTTLQLSDLKVIEFECKNCHRILSWPLENFKEPPLNCDCNARGQWMPHGGDTFASIIKLIRSINQFSQANNEPFAIRFVVRGISDHAASDKD
jgi:hypothetical protein